MDKMMGEKDSAAMQQEYLSKTSFPVIIARGFAISRVHRAKSILRRALRR